MGGGLMKIDGNATTVHHNGTWGGNYGLKTGNFSSIHLVSPLTKEMISTNNHVTVVQYKQLKHITNNNNTWAKTNDEHYM